MSNSRLLPSVFQRIHPKFRTPTMSIVTFCGLAVVVLFFAAFPALDPGARSFYARVFHGEDGVTFLGDLYAFGAATSYSFVFIALVALRLFDPLTPRKFKIPFNIPVTVRGEKAQFPIVAVIGFIGIFSILIFTLLTHDIGRVAGPGWVVLGIILYLFYRLRRKLPLLRSQPHDWRGAQTEILRKAGELELMDDYLANLKASDERKKVTQ